MSDDEAVASPPQEGTELARSSRVDRVSPVDLPEAPGDVHHCLAWTSLVIAVATAYLLVTNAVSLDGWLAEQPPSPALAPVAAASEAWLEGTQATGLATPRAAMHAGWKRAEAARFSGQKAAEQK